MVVYAVTIAAVAASIILRHITGSPAHSRDGRRTCHDLAGEDLSIGQLANLFLLSILYLGAERGHLRRFLNLHLLSIVLFALRRVFFFTCYFGPLLRARTSLVYDLAIIIALLVTLLKLLDAFGRFVHSLMYATRQLLQSY